MIIKCPKCKANLIDRGLIEKLDRGYADNHIILNEEGKIIDIVREEESFEHCSGYFCPSCDTLITKECPEPA